MYEAHRRLMTATTLGMLDGYVVRLFILEMQNKKKRLRVRAEQGHLVEGNL